MDAPAIDLRHVGAERLPVAVIDGFHPDPDGLRAAASAASFGPARHHYPGVRAELPARYLADIAATLATVLRDGFGHPRGAEPIDASFSIVTTAPDALALPQRLPHTDSAARGRIALVHYLTPGNGDGTAFFRHRATGFEAVDDVRAPTYAEFLARDLARHGAPAPGYVAADTPLFERIGLVPARYNRAVIYRSVMLHSGAISADAPLDGDPARGRLTVTAFLAAR